MHTLAIRKLNRPQPQGRRNQRKKTSDFGHRHIPDLDLERHTVFVDPDHARPRGRRTGERIKAVTGGGMGSFTKHSPPLGQLPIERKARHMGADRRDRHGRLNCGAGQGRGLIGHTLRKGGLPESGPVSERCIIIGACDEGHAKRQAGGAQPGWHR